MQVRIFTRLLALRFLDFSNVLGLHIWSVRTIPTYRVYRFYDDIIIILFNKLQVR